MLTIIISIFNDFNIVFNFMKMNVYNTHRNTKSYSYFLYEYVTCVVYLWMIKLLKFDII